MIYGSIDWQRSRRDSAQIHQALDRSEASDWT
jgi:hypothetical protein